MPEQVLTKAENSPVLVKYVALLIGLLVVLAFGVRPALRRVRIAPKEAGAGKIEVQIDGRTRATADLSTSGSRQTQQVVCEITGLAKGEHTIAITNRGPGPVAVDALIVR